MSDQKSAAPAKRPSRLVNLHVHAQSKTAQPQTTQSKPAQPKITIQKKTPAAKPQSISSMVEQVIIERKPKTIEITETVVVEPPVITKTIEIVEQPEQIVVSKPEAKSITVIMPDEVAAARDRDARIEQSANEAEDLASLSLNIASDYAEASLSARQANAKAQTETTIAVSTTTDDPDDSMDMIATATAEAIAAIRTATDANEIAAQVTTLQALASSIKANPASPELVELGDTIEKFVKIALKSTGLQDLAKDQQPVTIKISGKASRAASRVAKSSQKAISAGKPIQINAKASAKTAKTTSKSRVISIQPPLKKARSEAEAIENADQALKNLDQKPRKNQGNNKPPLEFRPRRKKHGKLRFVIALSCASACIAAICYFVSSNVPDISVRVAAMQTGIEAAYPAYVPRDYALGDISSEEGKLTMIFNGPDGASFTLVEEKSSWDSSALLRNFVTPSWREDYTTTHEQGITIYIHNLTHDAAWVNGGVLYKITSTGTQLTKKQVRNIVLSL